MRFFITFFVSFFTLLSCQNEPLPTASLNAFPVSLDTVQEIPEPLPVAPPDYDTLQWTELDRLLPDIILDLKYATDSNFVGEQMYACARAFLRPEAAAALAKVQSEMKQKGLNLKILDAYRPRPVQQRLWDKVPDRRYVTPPAKGSMHNRGAAVDLTLTDAVGHELDMGTAYDFFGKEAWYTYRDHPQNVLNNRKLLRETMEKYGFRGIRTEWWHFSFPGAGAGLSDWEWGCE